MLIASYDQLLICSQAKDGILGLVALKDLNPGIVLLTRLRKTRKLEIKKITQNQTIDVLYYD